MRRSKAELYLHLVWATWQRLPLVTPEIEREVYRCIQEQAQHLHCVVLAIGGMPDHVHLLVGCDPQFGIHRLVKYIKGTSSRYLRQEFPQLRRKLPSLWTNSYFAATVGGVTLETLKRYVEGQKGQ